MKSVLTPSAAVPISASGQIGRKVWAGLCLLLAFAEDKALRAAINQELVKASASLKDQAEVAFFPPVTGG